MVGCVDAELCHLVAEGRGERREDVGEVSNAVEDGVLAVLAVPVPLAQTGAVGAAAMPAAVGCRVAEADRAA